MALTKVTGDFIKAGSITQGHLHSSHGITTSHITEGDKLFFTNARVDSRVGSLSSSDLSEGTNLYYTDARARAAISGTGSLSYNSTTGVMSFTMPAQNTSNITEGSNLYYTDARADARVALIVDSAPGTLNTLNELAAALGDDANFSTTITNSIALKAPLASPSFTGNATFGGTIGASNFSGSSSGTNTGDQTLPTLASLGAAAAATTLAGYGITNAIEKGVQIASGASWTTATRFGSTGDLSQAAGNHALSVRSENNNDAFMSFHIGSDYAVHFGLDGASNRMHVGGWSDGTGTQHQLYDSRDFSVANVLNSNVTLATLGYTGATNANYITNNNQLTNGAGYLTYNIGTTKLSFNSGSGGATFGANHYTMGVDIANGAWTSPNYSDLIIGYHTGIRIGAAYGGTRFYANSPTTDTNNTGHGNGGEALIFTVGGAAGANDTKVEGIGYAGESFRAPIFYDSADTNSYFSSETLVLRSGDPTIYLRDTNHRSVALHNNSNRFYVLGAPIDSTSYAQVGSVWPWYVQLDTNDVYTGRIGYAGSSYRAPVFYDSNDTGYYVDANSTSRLLNLDFGVSGYYLKAGDWGTRQQTPYGWIQLGPANTSHAHIYTDRSNFYFNQQIQLNGGSLINTNDIRAQIFYDLNDTGYYVNPASKSILHSIHFNGGVSGTSAGSEIGRNHVYDTMELKGYGAEFMIGAQNAEININYRTCNGGVSGHTPTTWKWRAGSSSNWSNHYMGLIQSSDSMRAPIFYDSNNTSYYTDPGSSSSIVSIAVKGEISFPASGLSTLSAGSRPTYSIYQEGGGWSNPFPDLCIAMHTGIKLGANASYNGIRFYTDYDMSTQVMSVNNASDGYGAGHVHINQICNAGASMRSPIFYDSNNTGYYVDPADGNVAGNFSGGIQMTGNYGVGITGLYTSTRIQTIFNMGTSYKLPNDGNSTSNAYGLYWSHQNAGSKGGANNLASHGIIILEAGSYKGSWGGGRLVTTNDIRGTRFYDYNNTGYYVDPASTSVIVGLTMAGALQTAGSHTVGSGGTSNIYMGGTSGNYFRFHCTSGSTYFDMNSGNINWRQGSSTRFIFYSTTANMTVYGTVTQHSDLRIKDNVVEIPNCIDKVKSIRGIYYNRTDFNTEPTKIGVVAQEVEVEMPELVHDEETSGIKSVSYTELTAVLVNAIKEQQTIIDDLKTRLETLENQ